MSSIQESNESVARRIVDEVFNRGNAEAYDALAAEDYVKQVRSRAGVFYGVPE